MCMKYRMLLAVLLSVFCAAGAFAVDMGFGIQISKFNHPGYYPPKPGEFIMGSGNGNENYIPYYEGNNTNRYFPMFATSFYGYNGPYRSYLAFFTAPDGHLYFNDWFITPNVAPNDSIPRLFRHYGWSHQQQPPQDIIRLPRETTVTATRMGAPAPNEPIRVANEYLVNDSRMWFESPTPVYTDANGQAKFYAPNRSYQYLTLGSGGVPDLMPAPVTDRVMPISYDGAGWPVYSEERTTESGFSIGVNIYAEDRPVINSITAQPYDARYNNMIFNWEDLTSIPGHHDYELLIFEAGTRNLIQAFVATSNNVGVIMPVNTEYTFAVVAYDTNLDAYCNSFIYTFNTGSAVWTGARTMSSSSEAKKIDVSNGIYENVSKYSRKLSQKRMIKMTGDAGEPETEKPVFATKEDFEAAGLIQRIDVEALESAVQGISDPFSASENSAK